MDPVIKVIDQVDGDTNYYELSSITKVSGVYQSKTKRGQFYFELYYGGIVDVDLYSFRDQSDAESEVMRILDAIRQYRAAQLGTAAVSSKPKDVVLNPNNE